MHLALAVAYQHATHARQAVSLSWAQQHAPTACPVITAVPQRLSMVVFPVRQAPLPVLMHRLCVNNVKLASSLQMQHQNAMPAVQGSIHSQPQLSIRFPSHGTMRTLIARLGEDIWPAFFLRRTTADYLGSLVTTTLCICQEHG
jgi:hypothetical protein